MDIKAIKQKLASFAEQRNWEQFHTPKNLSMALAAEAAELLEIFQWLTEEQSKAIITDEKEIALIREEIADVIIYLVRLADKLGIDIEKAVIEKIALNEKKYPVELAKDNAVKYSKRDKKNIEFNTGVVVGIDVGGPRKGFHAVALRDGRYFGKLLSLEAAEIAKWCQDIDACVIGIDAPCCWSSDGRGRSAEHELATVKISSFSTPTLERAKRSPFYTWMLNGSELYRLIEAQYPLFDGTIPLSSTVCFETFPQAVACALAGEIVSAKKKKTIRRDLINKFDIDTSGLTNVDFIDAALCALTAHYLALGRIRTYGNVSDGLIVVPEI